MDNDRIVETSGPEGAVAQPAAGMATDFIAPLIRIAELAEELGALRVASDAKSLVERLGEGRFYVACVGQFKRGKSTLIGALIGDPILPAGVLPVTTVPTVVRYGPARRARVRFQDGAWREIEPLELEQYVSEEQNPDNVKGVQGAEVFVPCELLSTGMCFVDTPGLGSIFSGSTVATRSFVPHIDAALVVVGADPPLAGEELALVEAVGKQVRDLLIVLNKADRTTSAENAAASAFTRKVLEKRLGRSIGCAFEVSATERLANQGPSRDWENLVQRLQALVSESGRSLIRDAGERGLRRLTEEVLVIISEERNALLSPLEESERRIAVMRQTIHDAGRSLQDLSYLFMAEQRRLSDTFLARRKEFLSRTVPLATRELDDELRQVRIGYRLFYRREAMARAQHIAAKHVLPWLGAEQQYAEGEYKKVASRFVGLANEFLRRLSESGAPALGHMPSALDSERGFRVRSRFTFEGLLTVALPASPLRHAADVVLSLVGAHRVLARVAREFLEHLLETNSTRVQSDVVERIQESRGQLEAEIRKVLLEVAHIAERALEHARSAKASGAAAVEAKLARLAGIQAEVISQLVQLT
jgi:hypothetical protein